jgi:hypothetical protein
MMNYIFPDLILEGKVAVYLDDIMIFTKDLQEHQDITHRVLKILRDNKLYLKPEKCEFEAQETEYLGLIVGNGKICMDPVKVAAIRDWPEPKKKKELQSFLGFTNFYCCFIKGCSEIAKSMTKLTGNEPWVWGQEQQNAFQFLQSQLTIHHFELKLMHQTWPLELLCHRKSMESGIQLHISQKHSVKLSVTMRFMTRKCWQ